MQIIRSWLLLAVLSGHASTQAAPPDKQHEVQVSPGHTLKLWFNPRYEWRAKSYDQRYPGCTRQQVHRVYTADGVSLPDLLRNPRNLHWLSDPEQAGGKALYVGQLGLAGGMPPSKRVMGQAKKDLSAIAVQATQQGKMDDLRRALSQAQEDADFDGFYEQVFGLGTSEASDLAIFDLTVGEVQELPNYKEVMLVEDSEDRMIDVGEEVSGDAQEVSTAAMRPAELVEALYSPVESEKHQAACKLLKFSKYEAAYSKVLPLAAGLLYKQYVDSKDGEAYGLHVFWRYVLSGSRDLVGIHQVVLNMCCMEACRADIRGVLAKLHGPILDDITSWVLAVFEVKFGVNRKDKPITTEPLLNALEDVCGTCPCVLSYKPLVEGVLSKLRHWNTNPRVSEAEVRTLQTLARLFGAAWPLGVKKAVLDYALLRCIDRPEDVCSTAVGTLPKCLVKCSEEDWKRIVHTLRVLCNDKDDKVRLQAAAGLSKAFEGACSKEAWYAIGQTLIRLCKDNFEWAWVRHRAALSLSRALGGKCSDEAWHARVQALTNLCKDDHWKVRWAASGALSKALEGTCSEEAWATRVETLKRLCKDGDWQIRSAAITALSKGLQVACSEEGWQGILEALKGLCKDQDWRVRQAVGKACSEDLESVSKEVWKIIFQKLTDLCRDEHWKVREEVALGLSKGLDKCSEEACNAIVEALMHLGKDDYESVRRPAAVGLSKAISKCSEQALDLILEALTELCKDDYESVRRPAAVGLSKAISKCSDQACQAIIKVLKSLCKDSSSQVRQAAGVGLSKALDTCSNESWKTITEVLEGLPKGDYEWVRQAAYGSLGEILCSGHGDETVTRQAFATLSQSLEYGSSWDIPGPVYASLHALLFGSRINDNLRQEGWHMLCEGCNKSNRSFSAIEPLSKVLLGSGLSVKELEEGLLVLFRACDDVDRDVRSVADQALVQLMDKHQELLVSVLMGSGSVSSTVMEAIATYNPCLLLPEKCDPELSKRIQHDFVQERRKRGWPEALLGVQDLPSASLLDGQG